MPGCPGGGLARPCRALPSPAVSDGGARLGGWGEAGRVGTKWHTPLPFTPGRPPSHLPLPAEILCQRGAAQEQEPEGPARPRHRRLRHDPPRGRRHLGRKPNTPSRAQGGWKGEPGLACASLASVGFAGPGHAVSEAQLSPPVFDGEGIAGHWKSKAGQGMAARGIGSTRAGAW